MSLELKDTLPFGKHKGKTIEAVFKEDAGYLVWLRQKRKEDNQDQSFFALEVSALLDVEIRDSKVLSRKYKPWNLPIDPVVRTDASPHKEERSMEVSYGGAWGAM